MSLGQLQGTREQANVVRAALAVAGMGCVAEGDGQRSAVAHEQRRGECCACAGARGGRAEEKGSWLSFHKAFGAPGRIEREGRIFRRERNWKWKWKTVGAPRLPGAEVLGRTGSVVVGSRLCVGPLWRRVP